MKNDEHCTVLGTGKSAVSIKIVVNYSERNTSEAPKTEW